MSNVSYISGKEAGPKTLVDRLFRAMDGHIPERSQREIETTFRNRLERKVGIAGRMLQLDQPEIPGIDDETVRRVLDEARPRFTAEVDKMLTLLIGELLGLEVEVWYLQGNQTDN